MLLCKNYIYDLPEFHLVLSPKTSEIPRHPQVQAYSNGVTKVKLFNQISYDRMQPYVFSDVFVS